MSGHGHQPPLSDPRRARSRRQCSDFQPERKKQIRTASSESSRLAVVGVCDRGAVFGIRFQDPIIRVQGPGALRTHTSMRLGYS